VTVIAFSRWRHTDGRCGTVVDVDGSQSQGDRKSALRALVAAGNLFAAAVARSSSLRTSLRPGEQR